MRALLDFSSEPLKNQSFCSTTRQFKVGNHSSHNIYYFLARYLKSTEDRIGSCSRRDQSNLIELKLDCCCSLRRSPVVARFAKEYSTKHHSSPLGERNGNTNRLHHPCWRGNSILYSKQRQFSAQFCVCNDLEMRPGCCLRLQCIRIGSSDHVHSPGFRGEFNGIFMYASQCAGGQSLASRRIPTGGSIVSSRVAHQLTSARMGANL